MLRSVRCIHLQILKNHSAHPNWLEDPCFSSYGPLVFDMRRAVVDIVFLHLRKTPYLNAANSNGTEKPSGPFSLP